MSSFGKREGSGDLLERLRRRREARLLPGIGSYDDVRRISRRRLPQAAFEVIDGGAGAEVNIRENRAAFERVKFDQRSLVGSTSIETSTVVLGQLISMPIMLAPAGGSGMAHPEAELGAARAAGAAGTIFCMPTASNRSLPEVAAVATGPLWFQVFPWSNEKMLDRLVDQARELAVAALVITIDCPYLGNHERDIRNGATLPPRPTVRSALGAAVRPLWLAEFARGRMVRFPNIVPPAGEPADAYWSTPAATWDDVAALRRRWEGPLVVKGIFSVHDAEAAVDRGVDGVYVSNHGGRQLDGTGAALDMLPKVAAAVGDRVEVFLDSGVRRGEDVVKARALGARACFVGRPWFHAIAAAGAAGIERLLAVMKEDIERTLSLVGAPGIEAVGPRILRDPPSPAGKATEGRK